MTEFDQIVLSDEQPSGGRRRLTAGRLEEARRTLRPIGSRRLQRRAEYNARVHDLKARLEITGGTGNFMVNLCRSGTAQAERDKAARARQRPAAGSRRADERITTFGLVVSPEHRTIRGGTARQRACYIRAWNRDMIRYMTKVAA